MELAEVPEHEVALLLGAGWVGPPKSVVSQDCGLETCACNPSQTIQRLSLKS